MEQLNIYRSSSVKMAPSVTKDSRLIQYPPAFDMDFVERLLGRQKAGGLSPATRSRLEQMRKSVSRLLQPRLIWKILPVAAMARDRIELKNGHALKSAKMARSFAGAELLVGFVATVGEKIDRHIEQLMREGKIANAFICDALGSGAVENTAEKFQAGFEARFLRHTSLHVAGIRFSPGYCDWPVTEQHKIFSLIDAASIGVSLDNTSLMQPRKSVSAVFALYPEGSGPQKKKYNPCLYCFKKDCLARRSPAATTN